MIVVVDGPGDRVRLERAEDLKELSVELRSCSTAEAEPLLTGLGRLDRDHAWLDIAALRALSPLAGDTEWVAGFDGVLTYAQSKGWIDDTGEHVRAHLA